MELPQAFTGESLISRRLGERIVSQSSLLPGFILVAGVDLRMRDLGNELDRTI